MKKISVFWFRRDLRLDDNTGLFYALKQEKDVLPIFIFDRNILDKLEERADARVDFIHSELLSIKSQLEKKGGSLLLKYGRPEEVFSELTSLKKNTVCLIAFFHTLLSILYMQE